MKYIDALFVDGAFRPVEPIDLEPGQRVLLGFVEASRPASEPRAPDELSKLELDILKAVHSARLMDLEEIVKHVCYSIRFDGRRFHEIKVRGATREKVEQGLRGLMEMGYVQVAPPRETPAIYRVSPKGKVTEVHRRQAFSAARRRRPQPELPDLAAIGPRFEDLDLGFLDLGKRISNVLDASGFKTLGDVLRLSAKELSRVRGVGRKGVEQIEDELAMVGLALRPDKKRSGVL